MFSIVSIYRDVRYQCYCAPPLLQDSNTPLHLAARWDDLEEAKLLISHGADLEVRNKVGVTMISLRVCDSYTVLFQCVGYSVVVFWSLYTDTIVRAHKPDPLL